MKIEYDKEEDAAYIMLVNKIAKGKVKRTVRLQETVMLDLDEKGEPLGVEVLDASKFLPKEMLEIK